MDQSNPSFLSILKHPGFINLWTNQILVQLAYNSLNFALIIWVFQLTNSNTAVSALMAAVYLPAVLFGLLAGVLVDITDRQKIIMFINLLLALSFFSLIFLKPFYPAILLIAFFVNTLAQFYTPAESSSIPLIVKRSQLLTANSLFSITLYSTFLLGFGLAGPLISFKGIDFVFGLGGICLTLAFMLSFLFPSIKTPIEGDAIELVQSIKNRNLSQFKNHTFKEIVATINRIKGRLTLLSSILIMAGVQTIIGIMAVLIPSFLERVIQIRATDASYVLVIPLGLGMVTGGLLIGKKGYLWPKRRIVASGILVAGLLFFTVGIAPLLIPAIRHLPKPLPLPFFYQPSLSSILAAGSFLLGIALVSILVPSQTTLQENTREQERGKVFSVLAVVMSAFSLLPVLFVGILADLVGTTPIFILMGGLITITGWFVFRPSFFFSEQHLPLRVREFLGLGHWSN